MMRRFLHDRRGLSYIRTAATVLALSMLLAVILSFASWMTIVQTSRADTQRVLDSFCIDKAEEIYSSIKQGNNRMLRRRIHRRFHVKTCERIGS